LAEANRELYRTELEGIKAPLGVILFLIRKNNLDIYDIPIAKITKDYLEYLDMMQQLNIELAGEFFVMAATLMRIKAHMLLRKPEDEEDPREDLVRSLLEYQKMVEAARTLRGLEEERMQIFTRAVPQQDKEHEPEIELELTLYELMKAFREIAANFEPPAVSEIEIETVTIEDKIDAILRALESNEQVAFSDLFSGSSSRLEMIVTLIALLELMKRSRVRARQEGDFGAIWLYRPDPGGVPAGDADETSERAPAEQEPAPEHSPDDHTVEAD
jgi:segregation and condensation protein A